MSATRTTLSIALFACLSLPASDILALAFDPPTSLNVGNEPLGIGVGDIDSDGRQDLVVTAHADDLLMVFLSNGSAGALSFADGVEVRTGRHPQGLAVVDLDQDDKPEIIVANAGGGAVTILHNASTVGTVRFDARNDYSANTPHRLATGDLDGDGLLDIVFSENASLRIAVLLRSKQPGSFLFSRAVSLPTPSFPNSIAVTDVNADGKPDIVAPITDTDRLSVYLNDRVGSSLAFLPHRDFEVLDTPDEVAVADLNSDGLPEIVVANRLSNKISLFVNSSTETVVNLTRTDYPAGDGPSGVAFGDFNGDGKPDVVATRQDDHLTVFHTDSSGQEIELTPALTLQTGRRPALVATGDFDGDGAPDIAASNHEGTTVFVFRNSTTPCCDYPVGFGDCDDHPLEMYRVESDMLDPNYPGLPHTGEDWNRGGGDADLGDPVCSIGDGEVVAADSFPRWSNVVVVRHELQDGTVRWSQYAHLQAGLVSAGDQVRRGQQLGTIGKQFPKRRCITEGPRAGLNCAHLHFEIRQEDVPPDNWPASSDTIRRQYLDPTDTARDINPEKGVIESNR